MGGARDGSVLNQFIVELRDVDREFMITRDAVAGIPATNQNKINALSRVSLKLRPGEFVFLTGPSGAGKTTLLRIMLGLDNPTSGEVFTLGQPMNKLSESQRRNLRRNIGVIFQDHRLLNSFNVFENIELPLQFLGLSQKERHRRVLEILEVVQMKEHALESVQSLSAGEKQRIGIARSLVTCPPLIVADEPTGNLDPVAARSLIRMLKELKSHGTTVFIATHDMGLVRDFGGRVLELVGGSVPANEAARDSKAYKIPKFWNPNGAVTT
jgi:cell division transport system ATP-binding protein